MAWETVRIRAVSSGMGKVLLLVISCVSCVAAAEPVFPLAPARLCNPRKGLPNFLDKAANSNAEIKIAYLGGSITEQAGWRPLTLGYFQKTWPQAKFSEINAAIGGTGSDLGVFRLKQDVLDHEPDLLFVEFAVNDSGTSPDKIFRCMEGIVRQTWTTLPECDICFVYTLTESLSKDMIEGNFPRAASAMEKIADHYGIPTIHMAMEVAKLAREGKLVWKAPLPTSDEEKVALGGKLVFSPDGVHPHPETGHQLYLQSIVSSMEPIREVSVTTGQHLLPAPFVSTNYQNAKLIPITKDTVNLSAGFIWLDPRGNDFAKIWANRMTTLHQATQAGETMSFSFKGTHCSVYDIVGPDCGQILVTLDDAPPKTVPRFDSYCTYHRLQTFTVGSGLEDTVHRVKMEIDAKSPDKAKIITDKNAFATTPAKFEGTAFYPGAILVVGEIVK
jgi:hypothetical protein